MARRRTLTHTGFLSLIILLAAACSSDDDGGGGAPDADIGPPFDLETEREWTWVPVDGNECMNGEGTGIGVNLVPESDKLVVFLEGGGACFNTTSCLDTAHQDGYGAGELEDFASTYGGTGIFDRDATDNPVADWSWIFIPYCTGDVHAGSAEDGVGGRQQTGYGNVTRAVELAQQELGDQLTRVLLGGQSAGGFGAAYSYEQVAQIFDGVRVDLLDDSGTPLGNDYLTPCLQDIFREAWNLDATLPEGCPQCKHEEGGGLVEMVTYLSDTYPDSRFGYISSYEDQIIRTFYAFGYPNCVDYQIPMPAEVFTAGLAELRDDILAGTSNARAFTLDGYQHVWTHEPLDETVVSERSLAAWITGLLEDDPEWDSVQPPPEE